MKSALEIAMEKLEQESGPARQLNPEEKAEIAAINKRYDAEIATVRMDFDQKISQADSPELVQQLREEMAHAVLQLENNRDAECDRIWEGQDAK